MWWVPPIDLLVSESTQWFGLDHSIPDGPHLERRPGQVPMEQPESMAFDMVLRDDGRSVISRCVVRSERMDPAIEGCANNGSRWSAQIETHVDIPVRGEDRCRVGMRSHLVPSSDPPCMGLRLRCGRDAEIMHPDGPFVVDRWNSVSHEHDPTQGCESFHPCRPVGNAHHPRSPRTE